MATQRLSRLHKRILQWLAADHQRTKGFILSSHEELVKALQRDKGTISRSLRILEGRGWISSSAVRRAAKRTISRSPQRGIKGLRKLQKVGIKRQRTNKQVVTE